MKPARTSRIPRPALAALGLALALALTGLAAASALEPIGARINVFTGTPTTYPAGQSFHVRHGWGIGATGQPDQAGLFAFELDVDGIPRRADGIERSADPAPVTEHPLLNRTWIFNFPTGMTDFHGRWITPCKVAVEEFGYAGPCTNPNQEVAALERSITVDFVRTNLALGKQVTASSEYPGNLASLAVDGRWWSYWSSGTFPPGWIEVDLGAAVPVAEIDLGITQLPDCHTVHRLYGRADGSDPYALLHEFDGFTVDQQILRYVAPAPAELRFVRVETRSSCSWVGWREIEIYG